MGCGNQPVFTALEEGKDERYLTNKPSGADGGGWTHGAYSFEEDIMSLPFISLGYDNFPGRNMQGDCYSYTPDLNCMTDPKIDKTLINIKSDMSEFCTEYEKPPPDLNMRGHGADCLMIPAVTSMDYGKSEIPMNFTPPRCESGSGYPIKAHGAEAQNSRTSRFRMSGQFSSSESSTSLLPLVDNFGATGNEDDTNLVPLSSSSPQKIDRNFLTLGIGGGIGVRPNSNFSTREISNKLEEVSSECNNPIVGYYPKNPLSIAQLAGGDARIQTNAGGLLRPGNHFSARKIPCKLEEVSSQFNNSNIGHCPKNPLSLNQFSGGDERIQTNAGGLSRPEGNLATRMSACVEGALIGDAGFRLNSIPFPGFQTLQANISSNNPSKCYTSVSEPTPLLLPSGSTLFSQPKCGSQPEIASTCFVSQPISWQQDYSRRSSMKVLSESYRNHLSHRHKQSTVSHVQPGNLSSAAEGHFDVHNVSPIEAPGHYIYPERIGVQVSESSTYQSAAAGHFPKRLGLQPNDFATARSARGLYQHEMPAQSSSVFGGDDNPKGQVPVAKLDVRPQVAPIIPRPPLKRKAVANPIAFSGQRRKLLAQPLINDSTSQQRQNIPASIPPAPLHVKWKGFDEPAEASGQRCLLCKRDLSFTAEGIMYQPTAPPPVAVLPCGHTFHDHCLQLITPPDQSKTPPCIPCAIGET
ncbi:hypothetical protein C2S51_007200 [Perilla frutescens var. frutescens]|nr:hypothetical protein C2S51_007200 [Perilla frutescens var. frutescens]